MLIKFQIALSVDVHKDEKTGIWVSYNPDLDLYSQGNTQEEALEALKLGIDTHLILCHERGILFKMSAPGYYYNHIKCRYKDGEIWVCEVILEKIEKEVKLKPIKKV